MTVVLQMKKLLRINSASNSNNNKFKPTSYKYLSYWLEKVREGDRIIFNHSGVSSSAIDSYNDDIDDILQCGNDCSNDYHECDNDCSSESDSCRSSCGSDDDQCDNDCSSESDSCRSSCDSDRSSCESSCN